MFEQYPIMLGNEKVGEMTVGTKEDCHPECDYNIQSILIREEHRGKGIGRNFVSNFISEHPGIYCLDVPDKDRVLIFWRKTFNGANCKEIRLRDVPHGNDPTYYFKTRR